MKIAFLAPAGAMHRYNGNFGKSLHYAHGEFMNPLNSLENRTRFPISLVKN